MVKFLISNIHVPNLISKLTLTLLIIIINDRIYFSEDLIVSKSYISEKKLSGWWLEPDQTRTFITTELLIITVAKIKNGKAENSHN